MARQGNSDPFHHLNDVVADLLAEKGYTSTLKTFRAEVKKDKTSNVDSLVDHINLCVSNLNLQGLIDVWQEMDKRVFSRLHADHAKAAVALEVRLLKLFMVTAAVRNNHKVAQDCLDHMANSPRLNKDPEMRDWFQIPYIKHPETDPLCAKYCSKFWQDTLAVSLYNFVSSVYQTSASSLLNQKIKSSVRMDHPTETTTRKLQDTFGRSNRPAARSTNGTAVLRSKFNRAIMSMSTKPRRHISGTVAIPESSRNKPTSPVPSRPRQHSSASESSAPASARPSRTGSSHSLSSFQTSVISPTSEREQDVIWISKHQPFRDAGEYLFHLVCEEDYGKHDSAVVDCMFSQCATKVASYDVKGTVRVWKGVPPATKLIWTYKSAHLVTCMRWSPSSDDLIVIGDVQGNVKLLDGAGGNAIMEVNLGQEITSLSVSCDVDTPYLACGTDGTEESQYGVFVIDLATFTVRSELRHASRLTACFFHPKKSLLLCGFNTGDICEYNVKYQKFSTKLTVHSSAVQQVEYLKDEAYCISVGSDNKLIVSYLTLGGRKLAELQLSLPSTEIPHPFRHVFALNHDGGFAVVRCRNGAKVYKVKGRFASCFHLEHQTSSATSVDWCASPDKSTGILGYDDGSIRWFRLLHLS